MSARDPADRSLARDDEPLREILEAEARIQRHLRGVDERSFLSDELLRAGVAGNLLFLSAACARVSSATRARSPDVPWRDLVAARGLLVRDDASIDWSAVWRMTRGSLPKVRARLAALVAG